MNKRKAFTLIELLVVIAIIGILLSILLPGLKEAKKRAQGVVCRSNVRQIGFATILYAEDNDKFVPRGGKFGTWFKCFLPYVDHPSNDGDYRNVKIYSCPAFPDKRQTVCYVVSSWTFDSKTDPTGHEITEPTKLESFKHPMTTVYLADNEDAPWRPIIEQEGHSEIQRIDVWQPSHLPRPPNNDTSIPQPPEDTSARNGRRVAKERHRAGANYLFLDWHVEYIPTEDMTIDYWRDK